MKFRSIYNPLVVKFCKSTAIACLAGGNAIVFESDGRVYEVLSGTEKNP